MKTLILTLISFCLFSCASQKQDEPIDPIDFTFIAIGDVPYGEWQIEEYKNKFIPMLQQSQAEFFIHIGDIKGGSSACSDARLGMVLESFNQLKQPLFYTPGDNEWTDCHRPRTRAKQKLSEEEAKFTYPKERLQYIRKTYFKDPNISLGGTAGVKIVAKSQGKVDPKYEEMVENQMWSYKDILFASLHIVGSNNNAPMSNGKQSIGDKEEFEKRDRANIDWMKEAFAKAKLTNARALILYYHAEVNFDPDPKQQGGFKNFLTELTRQAPYFSGQILLIHGDSHRMQLDRPLAIPGNRFGDPIANIMRLEVPGGYAQMGYTEIQVLKNKQDFFRFRPVLLPIPESKK